MFNTQLQPSSRQRNAGGYPWEQTHQQPNTAFSNNQSQASNHLDAWPWLDANRLGSFQTEQADGLPLLSSLAPAQPNISAPSIPTPAGPPQSHSLNIIVKSDQSESNSHKYVRFLIYGSIANLNSAELHARIERLERLLGEVQSSLVGLTEKVEMQRLSHEENVSSSLEVIKKGMERFFTQFARHLEEKEVKVAEERILEVEEAIM